MIYTGINLGIIASAIIIILGVSQNISVGILLMACWLLFVIISLTKGYSIKSIFEMSILGGRKSFVVVEILLLIGAVTGAWMVSGTIPGIVYYSLHFIQPNTFILLTFIICCAVSFLLGSATGTASVVGLPLIIIARGGDVNLNIAAGAIIAGVYFGDRCSPMSSSAALVANLTDTNLFQNIRNMLYSSLAPFILSLGFYYELSRLNPLKVGNNNLPQEILRTFKIEYLVLIPIVVILVLSFRKISIKYSMFLSVFAAFVIAVIVQGYPPLEVMKDILFGFKLNSHSFLQNILAGGGVISMVKACVIVFIACCLAGILEGINAFDGIKNVLHSKKPTGPLLYGITAMLSTLTAALGCSQSIAVVMTNQIMKDCYLQENYRFALDIENSCILTSALIPWNVAALLCTTTLGVSLYGFIPYAFYLYSFPMVYFLSFFFKFKEKIKKTNPDHNFNGIYPR